MMLEKDLFLSLIVGGENQNPQETDNQDQGNQETDNQDQGNQETDNQDDQENDDQDQDDQETDNQDQEDQETNDQDQDYQETDQEDQEKPAEVSKKPVKETSNDYYDKINRIEKRMIKQALEKVPEDLLEFIPQESIDSVEEFLASSSYKKLIKLHTNSKEEAKPNKAKKTKHDTPEKSPKNEERAKPKKWGDVNLGDILNGM